jgi:hypothetical protein
MFSSGKTDLNYDVSINQGGQQVYSATGVQQYLYSMWDHEVDSAGTISPNVQYNVPYLIATGAVPAYDTSYGVSDSAIQSDYTGLNATNTGPMGTGEVDTYMPGPGGRADIGPQPNWTAQWLLSQNASAYQVMMADANASGGIPWHYTDERTGEPINAQTYPNFTVGENLPQDGFLQPANGWPQYSTTGGPTADGDPWAPDPAHMPDLNYIPYLTTGSQYQLELLQAQVDFAITAVLGSGWALDTSGTVPLGFLDTFSGNGNLYSSNGNQTRAMAWELREVAEAAYITPDSDPLKSYFTNQLDIAMKGLVQEYIVDNINSQYGQLNGFIQGSSGGNAGQVTPYEEDLMVTSLAEVAGMNIPQASAEAVQMLQYMNNFVAGVFTNGPNGFNPLDGTSYWMNVNLSTDPNNPYTTPTTVGAPITTWSQLFSVNVANSVLQTNPTELIQWPTVLDGGYGPVAAAALADEITYTQSPQAIRAYGFVVSQVANAFALAGQNEAAGYQATPEFSIMPRLPDGVWLENSQMQIDTSGASTVTLTATGGDSLLAVVGNGTATLTGGTGTSDLMFGGTGSTTFNPGPGNDYLFAAYNATGTQTFNDNTGNNYMYGSSSGPNVYVFAENNSGHDTIANFNISTDHVQIAPNLDGNGITNAAQLIAGATVSNGNTVLHLSSKDDITLLGVSQPSSLVNSILVS